MVPSIKFSISRESTHSIWWKSIHQHLTHWGRVTHICVSKPTIIGSDNGLSPDWRQAIIWTNAGILLIGPLGTNFSEILIKILVFSFMKMRLKMSSAKWRPFRLGLNVFVLKPDLSEQLHILQYILPICDSGRGPFYQNVNFNPNMNK